jgi:photosystem II stability/assembly factor-like uncharacterized protein
VDSRSPASRSFGRPAIAGLVLVLLTSLIGPASASVDRPRWVNTGPLGAPIYQLTLSAGHPSTLYGVSDNLIYRSDDGGTSWTATHPGLFNGPLSVQTMAVSAQNPAVVYAAGSQTMRKTADGGRTWVDIVNGLPEYPNIESVVVDPTNDQIVYVGGGVGLYKTTDGGADWSPAEQGLAGQDGLLIAVDPTSPSTLYAYTGGGAEIYKTIDGGGHWFASGTGIPFQPESQGLVVDPNDDQNVFLTVRGDVYHSYDGGGSWAPSASGVSVAWLRSLAVSTAEPNTLYAGVSDLYMPTPRGVYKSTDAGMTWHEATHAFKGATLAVDPSTPGHLYAGTGNYQNDDLGVFETTDGGAHWLARVHGMIGTHSRALAVAPSDQQTTYSSTNGDPGVYRTTDGGRSWSYIGAGLPEMTTALGVSPTDPKVVYAGLYANEPVDKHAGVYRSSNGGRTWHPANHGIADREVLSLVVDPTNADTVYAGVFDYCGSECESGSLWKTTDGGATWARSDSTLTPVQVVISHSDPLTVYYYDSSFIVRTRDGGETWVVAGRVPLELLDTNAIAVDPADPGTVYAGGWGGTAVSTDFGVTWTMLVAAPTSVNSLAIPFPGHICAGNSEGVWCSTDAGATWMRITGLNGVVTDVAVGSGGLLYAGSNDHGVAVHRR